MSLSSRSTLSRLGLLALLVASGLKPAQAQTPAPSVPSQEPAPATQQAPTTSKPTEEIKETPKEPGAEEKTPWSRIKVSGSVTAGATYNPENPDSHINYGRLFDDKANAFLLNQALLTVERPLDPMAQSFDWGFKLQVMYGSDARYTHNLGVLDNVSDDRNQFDVVEAYGSVHLPILTPKGVDVKAGQFVTLEGAEVIESPANFFYSHSYIFNYGIPLKHLGVLAITHVNDNLDLYTGITRGVNIGFDDNNDRPAFHGGVGLNFFDGKLAILGTTHIGPENPNDDDNMRYLHDIVVTIKPTDKLTLITDMNFARDSAADAEAYGVAQYLTYAFNDWLAAGVRGEVFRDDDGFFVAQFWDNDDFVNLQRGEFDSIDPRTVGAGPITYGALTFGLNIKPTKYLLVRPEIRFDRALGGGEPFNDFQDKDMVTGALAVTYMF